MDSNLEQLTLEVKNCCLVNNFYWGVWALVMLQDQDVCSDNVYHYQFATSRVIMYKAIKKIFEM